MLFGAEVSLHTTLRYKDETILKNNIVRLYMQVAYEKKEEQLDNKFVQQITGILLVNLRRIENVLTDNDS